MKYLIKTAEKRLSLGGTSKLDANNILFELMIKISRLFTSSDQRTTVVKRNVYASVIIKGISILVSLLLVPITLNFVASDMYGIWITLFSMITWLNFLDIGLTLGLKNRLAEAVSLEKWNVGKSLVSTTYFLMLIIFIPLLFVLELIIPHIKWFELLNVDQIYNEDIKKTLAVISCCFCFQMIVNVFQSVSSAFQKVALSSSFSVLGNIVSLLFISNYSKLILYI